VIIQIGNSFVRELTAHLTLICKFSLAKEYRDVVNSSCRIGIDIPYSIK